MSQPAILFDIGNVLLRFDFGIAVQRFEGRSSVPADQMIPLLSPFKDDLESGKMSDAEFLRLGMERIGFRGSAEEFAGIWVDIFSENEPMARFVAEISGAVPLYLFSNTSGLHKDFFLRRFRVFRHFEGGVYSHEARAMKPEESIYRQAMERFSLASSLTYYIDDLADNIVTGQRLGWTCHQYRMDRHEELEVELREWLSRVDR